MAKIRTHLEKKVELICKLEKQVKPGSISVNKIRNEIQERMTKYAAHIRSLEGIQKALREAYDLKNRLLYRLYISSRQELSDALDIIELATTHLLYLESMLAYLERGGGSRGAYVVLDSKGILPAESLEAEWRYKPYEASFMDETFEVWLDEKQKIIKRWIKVHPIPTAEGWFEEIWQSYRKGQLFNSRLQ